MRKGKLTPAARFARLRRRAARKRYKRWWQLRAHVERATAALLDPSVTALGWEMHIYSVTIPLSRETYTRLKRDSR